MQTASSSTVADIVSALSSGALKGKRKLRCYSIPIVQRLCQALQQHERITTSDYAEALQVGADTAYKAVMKPVEGTILTVARVTAEEARKLQGPIKIL